jgi:broad specificity phosphatase PhoE
LITLIRHGQAGSRTVYDDLSDTGRVQARALGKWFRERDIRFDSILAGDLERQKETALEMLGAMGCEKHTLKVDPRWSEFDLDLVYSGLGPLLAREDETFRAEYEQLQREVKDPASTAHRAWRHCDITLVRAWIEGRFEFEGESFGAFEARVRAGIDALPRSGHIAVITSATPIALSASFALDLAPRRVMQLAGALRNTAFTELELRDDGARLLSFNNVPHLRDRTLHTLR